MKNLPWKKLLYLVISWRLVLFLVGFFADHFLNYDPSFPYSSEILAKLNVARWLYSWANFDGVHYLTIADKGYLGTGLIQAFFPFFPLILSLLKAIFGQYFFLMTLLLQFFTTYLLVLLFFYFVTVMLKKSTKIGWLTITLLLVFPNSLFLAALYNEGLFLGLILTSFIFAKKNNWWLAGIFGALASATRVVGIAIWPALLIEWWQSKNPKLNRQNLVKELKTNCREVVAISSSTLGLLAYMLYLNQFFHDPLYFFKVQSEFGAGRQEDLILLPQVIWRYLKIFTTTPINWKFYAYLQEFVFSITTFTIFFLNWKKIKLSHLVFSLIVITIPTLTGTFSSMPRYIMAAFPIYYLLAEWMENKLKWKVSLLALSLLLLIINTLLFIQGYWVA